MHPVMSGRPTLKVTSDFTQQFNDIVKKFRRDEVLVGIPEQKTERKDKEPIGNAALLAIANFGSAKNNIPPWPIMAIGIRNAQAEIAEQFRAAAVGALTGGISSLSPAYNRAGIIASTSVKKVINEQIDVPADKPSEATLKSREASGFKGTKYWIRTGQMRNAITYVVRGEE